VLTGSAGSISGQCTDNGAAFEGTYPLGSGVYQVVRIECFLSVSLARYGINENDYRGTNTAAGSGYCWARIMEVQGHKAVSPYGARCGRITGALAFFALCGTKMTTYVAYPKHLFS